MSGPYRTMIKIVLQKSSALFEELISLFLLVWRVILNGWNVSFSFFSSASLCCEVYKPIFYRMQRESIFSCSKYIFILFLLNKSVLNKYNYCGLLCLMEPGIKLVSLNKLCTWYFFLRVCVSFSRLIFLFPLQSTKSNKTLEKTHYLRMVMKTEPLVIFLTSNTMSLKT